MTRASINSSAIVSIGYEHGVLEVEYPGGRVYRAKDFPQHEYDALMAEDSKGRALNTLKKLYTFERVEAEAS
jgi:hypothetical protein